MSRTTNALVLVNKEDREAVEFLSDVNSVAFLSSLATFLLAAASVAPYQAFILSSLIVSNVAGAVIFRREETVVGAAAMALTFGLLTLFVNPYAYLLAFPLYYALVNTGYLMVGVSHMYHLWLRGQSLPILPSKRS